MSEISKVELQSKLSPLTDEISRNHLIAHSFSGNSIDLYEVIYQNNDFVVINKPANLSFHKDSSDIGLVSSLESQLGIELKPVHRLDKITSGLLMFAKSKNSAATLAKLFENKKIKKTYIALSSKKPKKSQGNVIGDMKRTRSGCWRLSREKINPAITKFRSKSLMPGFRLFILFPFTGKTHQLRVALKSLGAPILGDTRYGGEQSDRGYLHATRLEFLWKEKLIDIKCLPSSGKLFSDNKLIDKLLD